VASNVQRAINPERVALKATRNIAEQRMSKMIQAFGIVVAAAAAAMVANCALYMIVAALSAVIPGSGWPLNLWRGAWTFGITFGLLSGAHWALALAARAIGGDRYAMRAVRIVLVGLAALAVILALTGERWSAMFTGMRGSGLVLAVAWLAMTHFLSKAIERRTPAEKSAGT
jgi:hypothetical protein